MSSIHQPWTRVYLYTGANEPQKPIGDLVNRASFIMPTNSRPPSPTETEALAGSGGVQKRLPAPPMAQLVIENPRLTDEALYKCDVTYVKGKCPSISLVRVQVMALPSKAQIYLSSSMSSSSQAPTSDGQLIGPLKEREQLKLSCLVHGGRPQPRSVMWRKIDPSGRVINLMMNNKLRVVSDSLVQLDLNQTLSSSDLGARFECHVEHEALESPSQARILTPTQADSTAKSEPESWEQPDSMLDLHPARGLLPATPVDSETTLTISQTRDSSKSLDAHVVIDLNLAVSSVDLFMTKFNKRNSSEQLREGDLLELECVAYNSKPPANISWFNGNELIEQLGAGEPPVTVSGSTTSTTTTVSPLKAGARHKRLLQRNYAHLNEDGQTYNTHSFLSIKLSRNENKALISCQAQNALMSEPLSKSIELQVQHTPIILMEPAAGLVVNEHDIANNQVTIYCIYSANPVELLPNSTRWFRNNQLIELESEGARYQESFTATGYPVLSIQRVTRKDAGLYDCQLSNSIGTSDRLPSSEAVRVEVNFKPSVQIKLMKPIVEQTVSSTGKRALSYPMEELMEVDMNLELTIPGSSYVLVCDILEAKPTKIGKFYWFKRAQFGSGSKSSISTTTTTTTTSSRQSDNTSPGGQQLLSISESNQFVLSQISQDFQPTSYSCAASNSLGIGEHSNQVELQLSYTPGAALVRSIGMDNFDLATRRAILSSSSLTNLLPVNSAVSSNSEHQTQLASRELLLECLAGELGKPKANIWLWFRDKQPIQVETQATTNLISQSSSSLNIRNPSATTTTTTTTAHVTADHVSPLDSKTTNDNNSDNPISELSRQQQQQQRAPRNQARKRLANGDLSKSSAVLLQDLEEEGTANEDEIKLKLLAAGRYLFIPSIQLQHKGNYSCVAVNRLGSGPQPAMDEFALTVAQAPSFVRQIPAKSYWSLPNDSSNNFELVCHVQCDPICQIEWLKNGEPLDLTTTSGINNNRIKYKVKQTIMDENVELNQFKSIESKLIFEFPQEFLANLNSKPEAERRRLLGNSNYTCQSSANQFGPSVRSTSKFVVQYAPENVIISGASDKLSLIEGSRGPRLICDAFGEPQVLFRWFLQRGNSLLQSDRLASSTNSNGVGGPGWSSPGSLGWRSIIQSAPGATASDSSQFEGALEYGRAINQSASRAEPEAANGSKRYSEPRGGANDFDLDSKNNNPFLVELTGSTSSEAAQVGGGGGGFDGLAEPREWQSILDLSKEIMDRKQAGHYICEASNKLGSRRQSIYVGVQYKPDCSTIHLHSLDVITGIPKRSPIYQLEYASGQADSSDEYSLLRETDSDYIDLRKVLLVSPLIHHGYYRTGTQELAPNSRSPQLSFRGSIFQNILNGKKDEALNRVKIKNSLIDQSADDNLVVSESSTIINDNKLNNDEHNNLSDSWNRFNGILIKFLNNYARQVQVFEQKMDQASSGRVPQNTRHNRRSQSNSKQINHPDSGKKNLITFACLARDGNPMTNLTFDWSFGKMSLAEYPLPEHNNNLDKEAYDQVGNKIDSGIDLQAFKFDENSRPIHLYSNENYTLHVMLIRRFDTKSTLNPFKMSLLTVNVILEDNQSASGSPQTDEHAENARRQMVLESFDHLGGFRSNINRNIRNSPLPVARNRYPSGMSASDNGGVTGGLKANRGAAFSSIEFNRDNIQYNQRENHNSINNNNNNNGMIELNDLNWEEQIGKLLKCSVSNEIGQSDVCHVQLNHLERAREKGLLSLDNSQDLSSTFEFAKWGMPSTLTQKSLLIFSLIVALSLLTFALSALLVRPYFRKVTGSGGFIVLKKNKRKGNNNLDDDESNSHKTGSESSNTVQLSTSSHKSSVLGLVGADNSTQGSSDDDSTGRHIPSQLLAIADQACNNYQAPAVASNYDQPRSVAYAIQQQQQESYNERTPDVYQNNGYQLSNYDDSKTITVFNASGLSTNQTASKILANFKIKSLSSKFKVDRISDLRSSFSASRKQQNFHPRNLSNAETNTTALSSSFMEAEGEVNAPSKLISPPSSGYSSATFFGDSNLRHSYSAGLRQQAMRHTNKPATRPKPDASYYLLAAENGLQDQSIRQMTSNNNLTQAPTYINVLKQPVNPMDQFIEQREILAADAAFYRSQSVRGDPATTMYHYQQQQQQQFGGANRPPVYPRSISYQAAARHIHETAGSLTMGQRAPPLLAGPIQRQPQLGDGLQTFARYSMNGMQYPYSSDGSRVGQPPPPPPPPPPFNISTISHHQEPMDTIDSHLNRLGHYQNQQQLSALSYQRSNGFNNINQQQQQHDNFAFNELSEDAPVEHIYDTNAYATPEQTPAHRKQAGNGSRAKVSQLIESFNSKLPE